MAKGHKHKHKLTNSPTFFFHSMMLPMVIVGDNAGILITCKHIYRRHIQEDDGEFVMDLRGRRRDRERRRQEVLFAPNNTDEAFR